MINQGKISIENPKETSNNDHTVFKNPFQNPDKGKTSNSKSQHNKANYTNASREYTIIKAYEIVATITVKGKNLDCVVAMHGLK